MLKKELKEFLRSNDNEYWYGCSYERMSGLIDKFFDQYQPERSKREDSQQCEMRCSEHCGNTVRDK